MAEIYFSNFMNVCMDVLHRAPYMTLIIKYKIARLIREGVSQANAGEILKCLKEMIAKAHPKNCKKNIFAKIVYFLLKRIDEVEEYVMLNIEYELECEVSGNFLEQIRVAELPNIIEHLPDETETIPLGVPKPNPDVQESSPPMSDDDFVELCKSGDVTKVEQAIIKCANVEAFSYQDHIKIIAKI